MALISQSPLKEPIIFHTRDSEGWEGTQLLIYKLNSGIF